MKNICLAGIAFGLLILGFCIGGYYSSLNSKVVTQTIYLPSEPIIRIEKVTVERETIKEVPIQLELFNSVDELELWFKESHIQDIIRLSLSGEGVDCDDVAMLLVELAREEGKDIHFSFLKKGSYFNNNVLTKNHALGLTIIRNEVYLIDALSGEISKEAYID